MTAKEFLSQAFTIDRIIKARERQIEELKELRFSVGRTLGGDKVQTSLNNDKIGDLSVKLLDLINMYSKDVERLISLKYEVKSLIDKLDNPVHRLILEERYINLKHWEDIAVDNNYSWNALHKIHRKGLKCMEVYTLDML